MFPVDAIPWPFSPPMPTAKSILFITPEPVFCYSARKFAVRDANKQAKARMLGATVTSDEQVVLRSAVADRRYSQDHSWLFVPAKP
jgi:hypothetical protein